MILKTLDEVTPEMLEKTDYVFFHSSGKNDIWSFGIVFEKKDNQWYERIGKIINGKWSEKKTPLTKSEFVKRLKEKYDSHNKKCQHFAVKFFDSDDFSTVVVIPRPHEFLFDGLSGMEAYALPREVLDKLGIASLSGYHTPHPCKKTISKKHTPAVRVNIRKMF